MPGSHMCWEVQSSASCTVHTHCCRMWFMAVSHMQGGGMLISESLWGVWNMILVQFLLQILCRFGYTCWCIHCVPSKHFEVEVASCENATAWTGNTNMYILCRDRPRLVTRNGFTPPPPLKGSFFYVANKKICVTASEETHSILLKYFGITSILIL